MVRFPHMRAADRRNTLALLASILLLAPSIALAQSCSISFDKNPIQPGEGTNLRWSVSHVILGPNLNPATAFNAQMRISNIGTVRSWKKCGTTEWDKDFCTAPPLLPSTGQVQVSPSQSTDYSGTFIYDVNSGDSGGACTGPPEAGR